MKYHAVLQDMKKEIGHALSSRDAEGVEKQLKTLKGLYSESDEPQEKESIGNEISDALRGLAELYENDYNIFETLLCLVECRNLLDDFPQSARYANNLLFVMGALLYLKVQMREEGMGEEFSDEIADIADRFPEDRDINMTACICMANLIPLCGSFDTPLSVAYRTADKMRAVAQRFGDSLQILEAYCHVLISVSAYARRSDNDLAYVRYTGELSRVLKDKADVLGPDTIRSIREHRAQVGIY